MAVKKTGGKRGGVSGTAKKAPAKKAATKAAVTKKAASKKAATKKPGFQAAKRRAGAGASPASTRADLGQDGSVAIARLPGVKREIGQALDAKIKRLVPGTTSVVKWGNACFVDASGRIFANLYETSRGVNLGLPGGKLPDPHALLEGTGAVMRHVKFATPEQVDRAGLDELIVGAAAVGIPRM